MATLFARLVLLLSLLTMPFGMSAAPASTPHSDRHAMAMAAGHCSDQPNGVDHKSGIADCAMACAAALPAAEASPPKGILIICEPVTARGVQRLQGIRTNPATPPPKQS